MFLGLSKGRREYAKSIIPPDIIFIARQRAWEYSPANIDRRLDYFVGSGFIDVVGALKGLDNIRKGEKNRAMSYRDLGRKLDLKGDKYIDGLESLIEQANKID